MKTVLDEVTSGEISADYIERRVKDWENRLNALFGSVKEWLPDGWEASRGASVSMHEELMKEFGVSAKQIPTLKLHNESRTSVKLIPHALWIIGANGRIDLKGRKSKYFIVDTAENFESPKWEAGCLERRCEREALSPEWLQHALE